jgi:vacuolar-type H+-ATPase subunit H
MPRGNDAKSAAAEFRGQYGIQGNAEDLIQGNRAAYPGPLRSAQLAPLNESASADLDIEKVGKDLDLPDGASVIGAAVRGKYIVAVVETATGHTYKEVLSADGEDLEDSGDEQKVAEASALAAQKIAAANAEADKIIADAIAEAQEKASKIAQDAADEAREKAAQDAKDADDEEAAAKPKGRRPAAAKSDADASS